MILPRIKVTGHHNSLKLKIINKTRTNNNGLPKTPQRVVAIPRKTIRSNRMLDLRRRKIQLNLLLIITKIRVFNNNNS